MTKQTLQYFIQRLPRIVLYIFLFYILFFVGNKLFYQFAPPSYFLNYTATNVPNNRPIYEGEPVPVTFCRDKRGNYPISGYRIFYKLDESGDRSKGELVANKPITNQITDSRCVELKITPDQYSHTKGKYFFRTYVNFSVNGVDKQVINESNTYLVEEKPMTTEAIQLRILELEKEIQKLKLQLEDLENVTDNN